MPPLTSTEAVVAYKAELESIDPNTEYLMTLYLHPDVTPAEIKRAAAAGVKGEPYCHMVSADGPGVKSYPRGVTTNSGSGIENYEVYYPVFKAMEEAGMVLNLHGEVPSDHEKARTILCRWLQWLTSRTSRFSTLRNTSLPT
jgi:dihydroorotase